MIEIDITVTSDFDAVPEARLKKFEPAEMITCAECRRANPPTRSNCLYCGADLPRAEIDPASNGEPATVPTEQVNDGDDACYIVSAPETSDSIAESSLAEFASLLDLDTREIQIALRLGRSVPLARLESIDAAETLADKLTALGVKVNCLREEALNLDLPIRKVRTLGISTDQLILSARRGGNASVRWADLILIVQGRLAINRVEVDEKRRRRGGKPLATRQLFADEGLLDLYLAGDRQRTQSMNGAAASGERSTLPSPRVLTRPSSIIIHDCAVD